MAFFKFRKGGDEQAAAPSPKAPVTVETMRKRARHRLIGAAVLVLLGVIGFPLLFDSQPRPIAVDITIEIPDKDQVKRLKTPPPAQSQSKADAPLDAPIAATKPVQSAATPVVSATRLSSGSISASAPGQASAKSVEKPKASDEAKPQAKADAKPEPKAASNVADKQTQHSESAKPTSAIEERASDKKPAASEARFVVQVGAFADTTKAREVRLKLERAGLKTYTQMVEAKEGKRIRVRVGPFTSKHEAEKAAEKIKKLDLSAGILEL
jgi:DedD protein